MEKWRPYYEWLALDIRVIAFALTGILTLVFLTSGSIQYYFYNNIMYIIEDQLFLTIISALFLFLTYVQGKFLIDKTKDLNSLKAEWKEGIVYSSYKSCCKMINDLFLVRSITAQVFVLLGIVSAAFLVVSFVALVDPYIIAPFILIAFVICLVVLLFILRRTAYLNRIITNVDEIVKGNIHSDIPIKGKSVLAVLAKNINSLKHGVVVSQKEQAKSERLKTELITNVSHDLRTPLTSIITYTELLKGTDVTSEDGKAYIDIIDRKSKRLKVLIDDLFEASKMASGNIELVKEKVDIVQLLHQALAEHNEVLEQSSLQLRVTNPDPPVNVVVDGQRMWRVFDNLIGNILKYSLENTRVYISITTNQDYVVITFKNVTKYELGENVDELFERFKRGDTSRQTDGSGLGLAIAKSIVDLHQGELDIDLDGDLFKVTIKLNL
ncbi:HAMP domain-containing sensor histidine kinase [Anaerobacillus sp. CMMVII]|uniref:sensor histidine kinase n=1 Tax=Anaerobacillus sp. CMMVII TaxID=2755588 RepID=UPI0021B80974|nr:HAMP domain-containing sensor histidine kinase [Anaerobacillus sp. CMMVII]